MSCPAHVLVVEDDETIRDTLIEFLIDQGFSAEGASDGRIAFDKLTTSGVRPCLIVLDLMMPIMDGRSFRERQLQDPDLSQIPVVVITAYRDVESIVAELRPDGYLKKPLKLHDLLGFVRRFC